MKLEKKAILLFIVLFGLLVTNFAYAALVNCGGTGQSPCEIKDIIRMVERIINFLLSAAWLVALYMILWSAFTLLGASGNEEAISAGKETLRHAIIGFFLIMISYLLVNWFVYVMTGKAESGPLDALRTFLNFINPKGQ